MYKKTIRFYWKYSIKLVIKNDNEIHIKSLLKRDVIPIQLKFSIQVEILEILALIPIGEIVSKNNNKMGEASVVSVEGSDVVWLRDAGYVWHHFNGASL